MSTEVFTFSQAWNTICLYTFASEDTFARLRASGLLAPEEEDDDAG